MQKSFKTLMVAILLSSTSIMASDLSSISESATRSLAQTEKLKLVDKHPDLFSGYKESTSMANQLLEEVYHEFFISDTLICPKLERFFHEMRGIIATMEKSYPQLRILSTEIEEDIAAKRFDFAKYNGYGFRALAAISDAATPEALSVFKDFKGDKVEKELRTNWQSPFSWLAITTYEDEIDNVFPIKRTCLLEKIEDIFDKEAERLMRPYIRYYLFNKGKLGLVTLIEAFIRRHYPSPIPLESQTAHGIPMTMFLFNQHDFFHSAADHIKKINNLHNAGYKKISKLVADKVNADQVAVPVAHYMVHKLHLIEDTLMELLDLYFSHYLPQHDMVSLKRSMVGFFEMMHESLNVAPEIYDMDRFEDIMKVFLDKTESKESIDKGPVADILGTNPLTGKTSFTPAQALEAVLASKTGSENGELPPKDFKEKKYVIKLIEEPTGKPMMHVLRLKVVGGMEYSWDLLTLRYKLANSLDNIGLLKIAGIQMTPPSEEMLASGNGRKIALDYLAEVEKNMKLCTNAFEVSALKLIQIEPSAASKSLSQRFKERSEELKQSLQVAFSKID